MFSDIFTAFFLFFPTLTAFCCRLVTAFSLPLGRAPACPADGSMDSFEANSGEILACSGSQVQTTLTQVFEVHATEDGLVPLHALQALLR